MALSKVRAARWRQLFRVFDINRDGFLDQEDFHAFVRGLERLKAPHEPHLSDTIYQRFGEVLRMDTDGDGKVTEQEWMDHCEREYSGPTLTESARSLLNTTFDLLDVDGDGAIGLLDYVKVHLAARLNPNLNSLVHHFHGLDENGNQHIERHEYMRHAEVFYLSDDLAVPPLFATV